MNMTSCSATVVGSSSRPNVDRVVLAFFLKSGPPHSAEFAIREDRVVTFNPELARAIGRYVFVLHLCCGDAL